jgi:uncharacterized membrane protein YeiH
MAKKYTAQRACGAVKFEFNTDPTFIAVCHCLDCKKATGGEAATFFGVAEDDFTPNSGGGLMRDLLRHDRVVANLRGELYPEIAAVWALAFAIFLEWEGARLQPEEFRLGVIVTILGVFLTRIVAIARGAKGWSYV